jgi:predicted nucleic acid-binding protein
MARNVIVDTCVLVSLIARNDPQHFWATSQSKQYPPPWIICEAVLSEAFFLAGNRWHDTLIEFVSSRVIAVEFDLAAELDAVLLLMQKYADVPMSLADACLVRMTEILPDPILLTTDSDFRVYRRHGRQVVPTLMPPQISKPRRRR